MAVTVDAAALRNMWESHTELPRSVPLLVRLALMTGGVLSQLGWFFVGFGLIFVHVFAPLDSLRWVLGTTVETTGQYKGSEGTNASENDRPVIRHRFTFMVDGVSYDGESYTTGSGSASGAVIVQYLEGSPEFSVIKGQRDAMFGPLAAFVLIFPIVGLFMLIPGLRHGRRAARLLAIGKVTRGTLVNKEATGTKINNQTVMKYTFQFVDELTGQEHTVISKSHTGELEDEETEALLYDPSEPDNACTVDNLPGRPIIENGMVRPGSTGGAIASLLVPAATILGHGAWYLLV